MRRKAATSRFFTITLPVILFIAGISATCSASKAEMAPSQRPIPSALLSANAE